MSWLHSPYLAPWWLALSALPAFAAETSQLPAVLDCIRANLPDSAAFGAALRVDDGVGEPQTRSLRAAVRRREGDIDVVLWVSAPPELSGTAYLIRRIAQDDSAFVYLPSLGKVRRISGETGGEVLGSTITTDDLRHLMSGFTGGSFSLGPTGRVHDWTTRRLYISAAPGNLSDYDRIELEITQPDCVAVEARFLKAGEVKKRLSARRGTLREVGGFRYASVIDIDSPATGERSELRIGKMELPRRMDSRWFDPRQFHRSP